ncbi:MAG: ATP-binding protein [Spirochaetota bacterium]
MVFLLGARQAGKTWIARNTDSDARYFSWDLPADRELIVGNRPELLERAGLTQLSDKPPLIVFDELHKFRGWKNFLKGFFDASEGRCHILVTGSAALDAFSRGGDSLMGRYFTFHCHPLSWREILSDMAVATPESRDQAWQRLLSIGGFPEPFIRGNSAFWRRWKNLRWKQLFREDLRDLTRSLEIDRIEVLGKILLEQATGQCNWSKLAGRLKVSEETIRRWVSHIETLHTIFLLRPWSKNISRSILQEPKVYFTDWSWVADPGARAENMLACQIRARIDLWQDLGLGDFGLYYLRDKEQREADFLVTRDGEPWVCIEVKKTDTSLAQGFLHMAKQAKAPWNFQFVVDLPEVNIDPFSRGAEPLVVPARTFLEKWELEGT